MTYRLDRLPTGYALYEKHRKSGYSKMARVKRPFMNQLEISNTIYSLTSGSMAATMGSRLTLPIDSFRTSSI